MAQEDVRDWWRDSALLLGGGEFLELRTKSVLYGSQKTSKHPSSTRLRCVRRMKESSLTAQELLEMLRRLCVVGGCAKS